MNVNLPVCNFVRIVSAAFFMAALQPLHAWDLLLYRQIEIESPKVCLNDIGKIYAPPAQRQELSAEDQNCILESVSSPVRLTGDEVRQKLLFLNHPPETVRGAGITITPRMVEIPAQELAQMIYESYKTPQVYVHHRAQTQSGKISKTGNFNRQSEYRVQVDESIFVPVYAKPEFFPLEPKLKAGEQYATLRLFYRGKELGNENGAMRGAGYGAYQNEFNQEIKYTVFKKLKVYRATGAIPEKEKIGGSFVKEEVWVSEEGSLTERNLLPLEKTPVGYRTLRPIQSGETISLANAEYEIDIRRGNAVDLIVEDGPFVITMEAFALEEGAIGEVILVETTKGRHRYMARITEQTKTIAEGRESGSWLR